MTCIPLPGAVYRESGECRFTVWAPHAKQVTVQLLPPHATSIPLTRIERGYHSTTVRGIPDGTRYVYSLDSAPGRPDPASRFQPEGVHGPSAVCSTAFDWTDGDWEGLPLSRYVLYELHVGTFTGERTFDAIIPRLDDLRRLGITAIELMPVAQFPGERNWGYDGAYPYAVQHSYGGPQALRRLVDACHRAGLAAVLDVVYNHFGPEGNYADEFAPYFTETYRTPWGRAINFDGADSDEVRRYFIENALYWLRDFHFDALRLDALHAILDTSATPFLAELSARVDEFRAATGRQVYLIGESDLNDPRLIRSRAQGGMGLDAQWSDDFHHSLHALLTGEREGYYADFGTVDHLAAAWRGGYTYTGQYSDYRRRRHGADARDIPPYRFVVCSQNHDQVGNRATGDRLSSGLSLERLKLAAACVILSPHIPLLFMGEEYGETAPFPYFVHHSDARLIEAVRRGRKAEFAAFRWQGELPDPQDPRTFLSATLNWGRRDQAHHRTLLAWYKQLLRLRRTEPLLTEWHEVKEQVFVREADRGCIVRRSRGEHAVLLALNFGPTQWSIESPLAKGFQMTLLDSADSMWREDGSTSAQATTSKDKATLTVQPDCIIVLSTGRK